MSRKLLIPAVLAIALLSGCGVTGHPVPIAMGDDQYIQALTDAGVDGSRSVFVEVGHNTCDALGRGQTASQLETVAYNVGFSFQQANVIVEGAIRNYCPKYSATVGA